MKQNYKQEVQGMLGSMLDSVVVASSNRPWSVPVILIWKQYGMLRFCVDYWGLNDVTRRDSYPSVRNYRSPTRHWRLTFRVGDHQLATWSPKKKKEKKKMKNRAVAKLSQRRRADRERAFFLPFFRFRGFGLIENETRIAKLPRVTRRPTRGATEQ